ncbi:LysR family transcriptional regulator [Amycolatopsis sp. NPDC048633]|uniref:LysR family transcriptional regulator n=1 Tax=Amycolatopsis sp. NPDC048633 TaxID=3157095 RepID=UPI0033F6B61B
MSEFASGRVELRHLRGFEAVARLRSFTGAAADLAITQPALSRTVRQLEDALGVTLFDRSTRHVELTGAGETLLAHVERALAELERGFGAVRQASSVRLGFSWLLPDPWAQRTVTRFERATGRTVDLVRTDDPLAALQQGKVDLAVVRGPVRSSALRVVHLFDEARVAACSVRSPLAGRAELAWAEVPRWPLVVNIVSGTTGPWSWPPDERPETIVETANFDEWVESVAADRGIGIAPEVAMRRNIHPAVRFVPLRGAPPSPVTLVFLPHVHEALLRQFVDIAVNAGEAG